MSEIKDVYLKSKVGNVDVICSLVVKKDWFWAVVFVLESIEFDQTIPLCEWIKSNSLNVDVV